jgi:hypothetical protein
MKTHNVCAEKRVISMPTAIDMVVHRGRLTFRILSPGFGSLLTARMHCTQPSLCVYVTVYLDRRPHYWRQRVAEYNSGGGIENMSRQCETYGLSATLRELDVLTSGVQGEVAS